MNDDDFLKWYNEISFQFNQDLKKLEETKEYEKKQNQYKLLKITLYLLPVLFSFSGLALILRNIPAAIGIIPVFLLFYGIIAFCVLTSDKNSIYTRINIKNTLLKIMLESFDKNVQHLPEEGISEDVYSNSDPEKFEHYRSKQLIIYPIDSFSNLKLAETFAYYDYLDVSSGKIRTVTTFSGVFAELDLPKSFPEKLYIKKDTHEQKEEKQIVNIPLEVSRVELDSQEFEAKFDVYSSNNIVAMQILTADVIQLLNDFYDYLQTKYEITIKENKVYIKIWDANSFTDSIISGTKLSQYPIQKNYRTLYFLLNISKELIKVLNETPY